jgi:hypothetical protein
VKRLAALTAALLAFAACTSNGEGTPGSKVKSSGGLPVPVYEVRINGRDCLAARSLVDGAHVNDSYIWSITCDWNPK